MTKDYFQKCFLLIPTRNRTEFLDKALKYYSSYDNCPGIVIADSSDELDFHENLRCIERYSTKLTIVHEKHDVSLTFWEKLIHSLANVKDYKYVALAADDDYLSLDILPKCIDFLQKSQDNAFAGGVNVRIHSNKLNPPVPMKSIVSQTIVSESPLERLRRYTICKRHRIYGYHRISILIDSLKDSVTVTKRELDTFAEYFYYLSVMLRGNNLCVNEIGYVITTHSTNSPPYRNPKDYDYPVHGQVTYQQQLSIGTDLLYNWLVKNEPSLDENETKEKLELIIRDLFEKKRVEHTEFRTLKTKYLFLKRILFPVKLFYFILDKSGLRKRVYVGSPDEFFNMRM